MEYHLRPAAETDVDGILSLIKDLATYEKEPDSVKATIELLRKNLFEEPVAHAFVAIAGSPQTPQGMVGFALYFFNFSTWTGKPGIYLEDLYVTPEFRGHGVGKAFFGELGHVAKSKGCARLDWSVLKWNKPSIDFYETKLGAIAMTDWMGMRLEGEEITRLSAYRQVD